MSKPTDPSEKDLLEWFDGACAFLALHGWTERDERAVAIRRLILNHDKLMTQLATWKERAEDLAYSSLERYPWIAAAGKFIDEISNFDFGKEAADER